MKTFKSIYLCWSENFVFLGLKLSILKTFWFVRSISRSFWIVRSISRSFWIVRSMSRSFWRSFWIVWSILRSFMKGRIKDVFDLSPWFGGFSKSVNSLQDNQETQVRAIITGFFKLGGTTFLFWELKPLPFVVTKSFFLGINS